MDLRTLFTVNCSERMCELVAIHIINGPEVISNPEVHYPDDPQLVEPSNPKEEESIMSESNKSYHPDIESIESVVKDRVVVKFTDGIVAEFKIALNHVTGVIVRKPGKKAQVYGGTKAIPPYYQNLISSGVVMEIYNDYQEEEPIIDPIVVEDQNVKFVITKESDELTRIVATIKNLDNEERIKELLADFDFKVHGVEIFRDSIGPFREEIWTKRCNSYLDAIFKDIITRDEVPQESEPEIELEDEPEAVAEPDEAPEDPVIIDDVDEFLRIMTNRRDFSQVDDHYKFRYEESDDNYDFEVEFDYQYDVVYFIVHCADKNDTEFINRVMGNAYKFSGYTGKSIMTVQMDLGDLDRMIDSQIKKFNILVDETLEAKSKSAHAFSAELVAKPQKDPEQERAAKRLEKFVRDILAPVVDDDPEWNSFFIDTPKEFKRYRLRTVGIMLTCYDMKSGSAKLKANPLFKKMSKAKKVVIQRGWQKALDPDGNKCWMCIFIDAEYAKEHGKELLEEKVTIEGKEYLVRGIHGNEAILEGADKLMIISTGKLIELL